MLELFPAPLVATVVYRRKCHGPTLPQVGSVSDIQSGDNLTFFDEMGRFTDRRVLERRSKGLWVDGLIGTYGHVLDTPRLVPFDRCDDAVRLRRRT